MMGWRARILLDQDDALTHVEVGIEGAGSLEEAKAGAETVLKLLANGRGTIIKVPPESDSRNTSTGEIKYVGYVRFSFVDGR
jgi:hypothetical protein